MKKKNVLVTLTAMAILALANPASAKADELPDGWDAGHPENGWYEYAGKQYWYEDGVLQGTEGRGKEIYDPASDAWYWLDSIQNGAMAVSKDVYQPYTIYGEDEIGKWVRYDENGHMVKGWDENENGKYYFDPTTGAMTKGIATIDGVPRIFHYQRGTMTEEGFMVADGKNYWVENGVRQGTEGRGKEIFDPNTGFWYWLDAVQDGAVAVSKDVYQPYTIQGQDNIGKWVRYDSAGCMKKGWDYTDRFDGNIYYFDPTTGAMAKGVQVIDGVTYEFDSTTGVLLSTSAEGGMEEMTNGIDAEAFYNYLYDDETGMYCGSGSHKNAFDGGSAVPWLGLDNEVNHRVDGHSLLTRFGGRYVAIDYNEAEKYYSYRNQYGELIKFAYNATGTEMVFMLSYNNANTPQSVKEAIERIDFSTEDGPRAFLFSEEGYKLQQSHVGCPKIWYDKIN